MNNYVTLFDKNFFSKGIMMINSLKEVCKDEFIVYVLAMDEYTYSYFQNQYQECVVCFNIDAISDMYPILKRIRNERTQGEFCWTLSSFSIQYVIREYGLESCTYLDADLFFVGDPQILIKEMGKRDVLITEHNYASEYYQAEAYGIYCVQFMHFKNTKRGSEILEWWRAKCEEWCYNRKEDGKFGDQKYLDDWEARFGEAVYNCKNIGCGLAPWNCKKYEVSYDNDEWVVTDRIKRIEGRLIFYHFHDVRKLLNGKWSLSGYELTDSIREFYMLYLHGLIALENDLPEELVSEERTLESIKEKWILAKSIYRGIKNVKYWYLRLNLPKKNIVNGYSK